MSIVSREDGCEAHPDITELANDLVTIGETRQRQRNHAGHQNGDAGSHCEFAAPPWFHRRSAPKAAITPVPTHLQSR
jgi:hypothetical protein